MPMYCNTCGQMPLVMNGSPCQRCGGASFRGTLTPHVAPMRTAVEVPPPLEELPGVAAWSIGPLLGGAGALHAAGEPARRIAELEQRLVELQAARAALVELKRLHDQYRPDPAPHEWTNAWEAADLALADVRSERLLVGD